MSVTTIFEDAKKALQNFSRNRKFKKANAVREEAAQLQAELAKCRGKLEVCSKDFNRTIKTQSRNIADGQQVGADTTIQEQMLWDAAIGYMLVKDATFALRTIASFDSVTHAYDLLNTAVDQIAQRQRLLPKLPKFGGRRERNVYGFLTSSEELREKQELLDSVFEQLKQTGDIEACLMMVKCPDMLHAEHRRVADNRTEPVMQDRWSSVLDDDDKSAEDATLNAEFLEKMMDIHPDSQ